MVRQLTPLTIHAYSHSLTRVMRACAAFVDFVCHLVSANGNLVEPCIRVLVARLLPSEGELLHTGHHETRSLLTVRMCGQTLKRHCPRASISVSMMLWNSCFKFSQRVRHVWWLCSAKTSPTSATAAMCMLRSCATCSEY